MRGYPQRLDAIELLKPSLNFTGFETALGKTADKRTHYLTW